MTREDFDTPAPRIHGPSRAAVGPLVAATAVMAMAGCSLVQPSVRAIGARVAGEADGVARLELELELANPGSTEIDLLEYDYRVELADGASYAGRWAALRALPADATVRAQVPAVVPAASLAGSGGWRIAGTVSYRDPASLSRLLFDLGLLENRAAFSGSGAQVDRAD
ncbi:MAG: hypothetical protein RI967_1382 [Planctomycetota bacterium]|jgi:hypothetical protein